MSARIWGNIPVVMDVLRKLFEQHFRHLCSAWSRYRASLGVRPSHRPDLWQRSPAIGILHNVREENVAFIEFSRHFRRHGCPFQKSFQKI